MKIAVIILLLSLVPLSVFPWGRREKKSVSQQAPVESIEVTSDNDAMDNTIKITGRVEIFGNVPHTFIGIVSEDGRQYAVYPPEQEEQLKSLQGHLIEFTVELLDEGRGYGSLFLRGGTVTPLSWEILR